MSNKIFYIALDFDGVLHHVSAGPYKTDKFDATRGVNEFVRMLESRIPSDIVQEPDFWVADGRVFDRICYLERLLALAPGARVVLATSWRNKMQFEHLKQLFPAAVQQRIAGVLESCHHEGDVQGLRGEFMQRWIEQYAPQERWIALDDQPSNYANHSTQLVQTHWRGMDEQTVQAALDCVK